MLPDARPAMSGDTGALAQALAYAHYGWPVFPCKPGSKEPATLHGFKEATTDHGRIQDWWTAVPGRNVAIATGAPGPDVLDVDVRPQGSGYAAFRRLRRAGLADGFFAVVATPGGGLHAYYTGTGQRSGRLPARHLDFKAAGGYVLAPPSQIGGRSYQLIRHQDASASLDWAVAANLLDPPGRRPQPALHREGTGDPGRLAAWVAVLNEGNRNAGLFWAACRLAETGHADAFPALAEAARSTGLPESEITRTLLSARRTVASERPAHGLPDQAVGVEAEAAS
jgi:hypothetical protein